MKSNAKVNLLVEACVPKAIAVTFSPQHIQRHSSCSSQHTLSALLSSFLWFYSLATLACLLISTVGGLPTLTVSLQYLGKVWLRAFTEPQTHKNTKRRLQVCNSKEKECQDRHRAKTKERMIECQLAQTHNVAHILNKMSFSMCFWSSYGAITLSFSLHYSSSAPLCLPCSRCGKLLWLSRCKLCNKLLWVTPFTALQTLYLVDRAGT